MSAWVWATRFLVRHQPLSVYLSYCHACDKMDHASLLCFCILQVITNWMVVKARSRMTLAGKQTQTFPTLVWSGTKSNYNSILKWNLLTTEAVLKSSKQSCVDSCMVRSGGRKHSICPELKIHVYRDIMAQLVNSVYYVLCNVCPKQEYTFFPPSTANYRSWVEVF